MKFTGFHRIAQAEITLIREEATGLMWLSAHHYDPRCREAGQVGGFLYGINNHYYDNITESDHTLSFNQVDTLTKITEPIFDHPKNMIGLHLFLKGVLIQFNQEYRRLNPEEKPDET